MRYTWRLFRVVLHVIFAFFLLGVRFPFWTQPQRKRCIQQWSRKLLTILGVRVTQQGNLPENITKTGVVVVANHISWLDIFVINSILPVVFVAKSELNNWPLFGYIMRAVGTLFINRENKRDALRINEIVHEALQRQEHVAFFPEAKTGTGETLQAFKTALLQPAAVCQAPVLALGLCYCHAQTKHIDLTPAYVGEMSFGTSLKQILSAPHVHVEVRFPENGLVSAADRRTLTQQVESIIHNLLFPSR